ncbi:MAG: hypothetical protein IPM53_30840 [Anaerolineaceae bacterium]|nr:hypothetical protein [Anaerolineaceae bacterium]
MTYFLIRHLLRSRLILLLTILTVSTCTLARNSAQAPESAAPDPEIVFVGDVGSFPAGCGPQDMVAIVNHFIEIYNAGDVAELEQFFADQFTWYTDGVAEGIWVDPATYFETSRRDELGEYVYLRHTRGERLKLLEISVAGPGCHDGMDITFTLAREADDLPTTPEHPIKVARGKGMVTCPEKRIAVWSMATQQLGNIPEIVAQDASYNVVFDDLPAKIIVHARNEGVE